MKEQPVKFYSAGSVEIYGTLSLPYEIAPKESMRLPAVALAHGYGAFRDELTGFVELAQRLAKNNIIALRFDFRGCVESGELGRIHPQGD